MLVVPTSPKDANAHLAAVELTKGNFRFGGLE